jgi:signal transduction histidine kinase
LTAVVTGGGWVAGFVRWQNRQGVQARVDAQLEAAERRRLSDLYDIEQERRRIAADMHDVVAHSWAVVAAQSDGARYGLRHDPAGVERALEVIGETARTAIGDLRTIVAQLRDPGLAPSTPGFAQQAEVLERMRSSGMDLDFREIGTRDESPLIALTAHRLLSEALTNALKHGDLTAAVRVEQDWLDGYRLTVTNRLPLDVVRGDAGQTPGTGHGLVGMAERTTVAGGTFSAGSEGGVWVLRAHVPRTPAAPASSEAGP